MFHSEHNNLLSYQSYMEEKMIGETIIAVTCYEINRAQHSFSFDNFDNADLGINIEFGNGFYWHLGWKGKYFVEAGQERYNPAEHYEEFTTADTTKRWKSHTISKIKAVSFKFIDFESKQFDQAHFHFEDGTNILIVIGEELNLDTTIPNPLYYSEQGQIYIFFDETIPEIPERIVTLVELEHETDINPRKKRIEINTNQLIGFFLVVMLLLICFYRYFRDV